MKNFRRSIVFLLSSIFFISPLLLSSCFISGSLGMEDGGIVEVDMVEESGSGELTEEEFEQLLSNTDFLETFDTFYYPGSSVQEAIAVQDELEMIYVILETAEGFDSVEEYYKNKKVQSIWNRDFIYQKSTAETEEDIAGAEEEDVSISKFTYSSKDRDKIVDILLKELAADRTQIMVTFWDLQ
ncbi:MAG: hypothetical protein K8S14_05755 [Actinomycetia bacterium]|nr:hypothetical protein [Actinomycetes bacterium]